MYIRVAPSVHVYQCIVHNNDDATLSNYLHTHTHNGQHQSPGIMAIHDLGTQTAVSLANCCFREWFIQGRLLYEIRVHGGHVNCVQ